MITSDTAFIRRSRRSASLLLLSGLILTLLTIVPQSSAVDLKRPAKNGQVPAATIRVGKHPAFVRIVLEAPESLVQKASVMIVGGATIKVDFPSPLIFKVALKGPSKGALTFEKAAGKGKSYEVEKGVTIAVNESKCLITVNNLDDINVSKLTAPPRLVIDASLIAVSAPPAKEQQGSAPPQEHSSSKESGAVQPPPEPVDIPFSSFVLDAGHGGSDTGIQYGKVTEKDIALSFAKDVATVLSKKGKRVFLTRKADQALSLKERARIANQKSPDIFLSFHLSSQNAFIIYSATKKAVRPAASAPNEGAGTEAKDMNAVFASAIARQVRNEFKTEVRYERLPIRVLTQIGGPALLIELPSPEKFSYEGKNKERLIHALLRGIASSAGESDYKM
ncbi:MAG: N-acetylmuramoyl-L-alanine amidase [Nitrospirota bacterium]